MIAAGNTLQALDIRNLCALGVMPNVRNRNFQKRVTMTNYSTLERAFIFQWRVLNERWQLLEPVTQYRFAAYHVGHGKGIRKRLADARLRDWRADFAWPDHKLLVELEGGTFTNGRHVRPKGFRADCEKYNAAQKLGFIVLRYTSDMVYHDFWQIMDDIVDMLNERRPVDEALGAIE